MRKLTLGIFDSRNLRWLLKTGWWLAVFAFCLSLTSISSQAKSQPQQPQELATLASSALSQRNMTPAILGAHIQSIDLTPYAEYWIDDSKTTSLETVQARATAGVGLFKASKATDAHKINGKVLWLRFDVKSNDLSARWILELGSPLVDDVKLFWRNTNGQWMSLKAGDIVPREQWPLPTRLPAFALQAGNNDVVQHYLRVENARVPVSLPMHVYRDSEYLEGLQVENMLLGALAGLIGLMLLCCVWVAIWRREQAFIACSVYLVALGLYNLTSTGLTPLYWWNESPLLADRMNYALAALTAALGPWLVNLIVQPVVRVRTMNTIIAIQAVMMIFCTAAEIVWPTKASYALLNLGVLMSVVLVYAVISAAWQRGEAITRWVALSFAPVALSALPLILRNFGLIPNSLLTQSVVSIATAIELPLLMYALLTRSNMRREGLARASGLRRKDALTGLPNTYSFLEQMQGVITRSTRFKHAYGLILVELANHDWFAKEHGREMADRAVLLTSTRLQQQVRDVDTVCRFDESNFVILVEGACTPRQLAKLAAGISAGGHAPTEILPVGASLRLSICCALMPTESSQTMGEDANAQLGWLIATAEAEPIDQRKLIRSLGF